MMHATSQVGRRGATIFVVVAVLAVVAALASTWTASALRRSRQTRLAHLQVQADWLATAGVARARVQVLLDKAYDGETWRVPASELRGGEDAEVAIQLDEDELTVRVAIPPGDAVRVRVTRRAMLAAEALPDRDD
ncbi:hypothetical protein Pla175_45200 [Pirellulimonas nuda]|uniref:Uncharacterized protein n=1 Tax=Pirellulimonas nuda TaxID=2528009 RepID=A0A518DI77_9BACT|nr:hypothetical protein [Pirellulimonas nuda]QDU91102.1 hypothetical protein Pla175_45200 [Pirellulimonas nuda]